MTIEKLLSFSRYPDCPECGSNNVSLRTIYHRANHGWFVYFRTPWPRIDRCKITVKHFHVQCFHCGDWHARATADIRSPRLGQ